MRTLGDLSTMGEWQVEDMLSTGEVPPSSKPVALAIVLAHEIDWAQTDTEHNGYHPDDFAEARATLSRLFDALADLTRDKSLRGAARACAERTFSKVSFRRE